MNPLFERDPRQIIPRWRDFAMTAALGEVAIPLTESRPPIASDEILVKRSEWISNRTAPFASDLIAAAVATGDIASVRDAIDYFIDPSSEVSPLARRVALNLVTAVSPGEFAVPPAPLTKATLRSLIRDQKSKLRFEPRDPLAWAELARGYILLGFRDHAKRALGRALTLAPDNRFLLRSYARLLVHLKEPDHALRVLRCSEAAAHDPWLIAAELAVAGLQKRPSLLAKAGLRLVAQQSVAPFHITELASALGTLEAASGSFQKSKKLFRLALIEPTENSVAQAQWASAHGNLISLSSDHFNVPLPFEARAQYYLRHRRWSDAYNETINWLNDQPFALAPAIQGSYVASVVLENYDAAIGVIEFSQIANPHDWILKNNLAFAHASADRPDEAREVFNQLASHDGRPDRHGVWLATAGLIEFRSGRPERGVLLYRASIDEFARAGMANSKALATAFLAREACRAGLSTRRELLKAAEDAAAAATAPEVSAVVERIDATTE